MITIEKKRFGLNYTEIWFPNDEWKNTKCDMIRLHCLSTPAGFKKAEIEMQHTRITDLTSLSLELADSVISKTFKYDIRRSYKDEIEIKFFSSNELVKNDTVFDMFAKCYHSMYQEKGMDIELDIAAVKKCAQNKHLFLSIAFFHNEPVVFHSYLYDEETVILWHSCSNFRSEKEIVNIIGRANKRLHWEDWLFFKSLGVKKYDWGGVFSFDSDNGIDQFKEAFGGEPLNYYHTIPMGHSFIGKVAIALYRFLSKKG